MTGGQKIAVTKTTIPATTTAGEIHKATGIPLCPTLAQLVSVTTIPPGGVERFNASAAKP